MADDGKLTPEQQQHLIAEAEGEAKRLLEFAAAKRKEFGITSENGGGGRTGVVTLEQFQKLSPAERTQFYRDNPTQYSTFMDAIRTASERALFNKGAPGGPEVRGD
jgi:hypothetical protein